MLQAETARKRLRMKRKKLAGNMLRALKVREQLTKQMKEENTIRSQLDKQAAQKGEQMLEKKTGAGKAPLKPQELSKHELMDDMRASLRKEEEHKMAHNTKSKSAHEDSNAPVSLKKLSAQPHMEAYLRKELDSASARKKDKMYSKSVKNSLLRGVEKLVKQAHGEDSTHTNSDIHRYK